MTSILLICRDKVKLDSLTTVLDNVLTRCVIIECADFTMLSQIFAVVIFDYVIVLEDLDVKQRRQFIRSHLTEVLPKSIWFIDGDLTIRNLHKEYSKSPVGKTDLIPIHITSGS